MKKTILSMLIFTALLVRAAAGPPVTTDSITISGKEYLHATISRVDQTSAKIAHEAGVSRVKIVTLPDELKKQFIPEHSAGSPPPVVDFPLKDLAKDDPRYLSAIYQVTTLKNSQRILSQVNVVQSIGADLLLARLGDSMDFVMITGDNDRRADGDQFSAYLADAGRLQEYTTVLGAKKTVRVYSVQASPSEEAIVAAFKAGQTLLMDIGTVDVPCNACADHWRDCPKCHGLGKITIPQQVRVCWEIKKR